MVVPACNASTKKVEDEGSEIQSHLRFHSESKTNRNLCSTMPGHAHVFKRKSRRACENANTLHRNKTLISLYLHPINTEQLIESLHSFSIKIPFPGLLFHFLKVVHFNSLFFYTKIMPVELSIPGQPPLLILQPLPASEVLGLQLCPIRAGRPNYFK